MYSQYKFICTIYIYQYNAYIPSFVIFKIMYQSYLTQIYSNYYCFHSLKAYISVISKSVLVFDYIYLSFHNKGMDDLFLFQFLKA